MQASPALAAPAPSGQLAASLADALADPSMQSTMLLAGLGALAMLAATNAAHKVGGWGSGWGPLHGGFWRLLARSQVTTAASVSCCCHVLRLSLPEWSNAAQ